MSRIDQLCSDDRLIEQAVRRATQRAVQLNRLLGLPVASWRDGKVVWIPPEEIPVITDEQSNGITQS